MSADKDAVRQVWGDDAVLCPCGSWHHKDYHDNVGYVTQAILDETADRPDLETPTVPDAYMDCGDLIFAHRCTSSVRHTVLSQDRWAISQGPNGELSVSPSIYCKACGLHGYFRMGEWSGAADPVPLPDSSSDLPEGN